MTLDEALDQSTMVTRKQAELEILKHGFTITEFDDDNLDILDNKEIPSHRVLKWLGY